MEADLYSKPVTAYVQHTFAPAQQNYGAALFRPTSAPPQGPGAAPPPSPGAASPPTPLLQSNIEARLEAVRSELAKLRSEWPSPRGRAIHCVPSHASSTGTPAKAAPRPNTGVAVNPDQVLYYMSRFEPRRLRSSASSTSSLRVARRDKALGSTQSDFVPGQHPIGYRPLSGSRAFKSAPAYSFRKKLVLSRDVDPYAADDTPGPGAYHTSDY